MQFTVFNGKNDRYEIRPKMNEFLPFRGKVYD